jgi:hypothetical protein
MKVILISLILALTMLFSCRVKDTCELNNSGSIFVTNNTGSDIEVFIDNSKVFDLTVGQTKSVDKPVGTYTVKCLSFPDEWTYEASVVECESFEINVPE